MGLWCCPACGRHSRQQAEQLQLLDDETVWAFPVFVIAPRDPEEFPMLCAECGAPSTRFVDATLEVGPSAKWISQFLGWLLAADTLAFLHRRIDSVGAAVPHCDAHVGGAAMVARDQLAVRSYRFYCAARAAAESRQGSPIRLR